jgi:hypothetical protein
VCSAIFWAWSAIKQRLSRGPDEALGQTAGSRVMMKSRGMVLVGAAATALEQRRKLMDAWSAYCEPKASANIVQPRNFLGETVTRSANAKP